MSEKHSDWDYENAEVHEGNPNPSSVYSVRFPKQEMRAIRAAAKLAGISTSAFIREAACEKARYEALLQRVVKLPSTVRTSGVTIAADIVAAPSSHSESLPT